MENIKKIFLNIVLVLANNVCFALSNVVIPGVIHTPTQQPVMAQDFNSVCVPIKIADGSLSSPCSVVASSLESVKNALLVYGLGLTVLSHSTAGGYAVIASGVEASQKVAGSMPIITTALLIKDCEGNVVLPVNFAERCSAAAVKKCSKNAQQNFRAPCTVTYTTPQDDALIAQLKQQVSVQVGRQIDKKPIQGKVEKMVEKWVIETVDGKKERIKKQEKKLVPGVIGYTITATITST